jgi:hypothetical protein
MKTIGERWREFEAESGLMNSSRNARRDARRSFYAGFYSALLAAVEAANERSSDEADTPDVLEAYHAEIRRFVADRVSGRV